MKFRSFARAAFGPVGVLACLSCGFFSSDVEDAARLVLELSGTGRRTISPPECSIASYEVSACGPDDRLVSAPSLSPRVELDLVPGDWTITADGLSAGGTLLARGMLELCLESGERSTRSIDLWPLKGDGGFALHWTVEGDPGGDAVVEGSLFPAAGAALPLSAPASARVLEIQALPAGAYRLEVSLRNRDGRLCGFADSVLILAGQLTKADANFTPPEARLEQILNVPNFVGAAATIVPSTRRVAAGIAAAYAVDGGFEGDWFLDGESVRTETASLRITAAGRGSRRIDWLGSTGGIADGSSSARLVVGVESTLGELRWAETLAKEDFPAGGAVQALDDCRDLVFSPAGTTFLAIGRNKASLGVFRFGGAGDVAPLCGLGKADDARLGTPGKGVALPEGLGWVVLSGDQGTVSLVIADIAAGRLALTETLTAPELAGATDLVLAPDKTSALVTVPDSNAVYRIPITPSFGTPVRCADPSMPGLEGFSKPASLALDFDGGTLAVGTLGDDGIYFFAVAQSGIEFLYALSKEAFTGTASLSDPVSLVFSPDRAGLYVLSYYGKALIALERNPEDGRFVPAWAAKSGSGGISGFDYPKRMALSPDESLLAISGSGTQDGLTLFSVAGPPLYLGTLRSGDGDGALRKPLPVTFSPDGTALVVASSEEDKLAVLIR